MSKKAASVVGKLLPIMFVTVFCFAAISNSARRYHMSLHVLPPEAKHVASLLQQQRASFPQRLDPCMLLPMMSSSMPSTILKQRGMNTVATNFVDSSIVSK